MKRILGSCDAAPNPMEARLALLRSELGALQLPPLPHPNDEQWLRAFLVPQNGWYCVAHYILPHDAAYAINAVSVWDLWSKDPDELLVKAGEHVAGLWKAQMKEAA
jgi:hypothetical protein